MNDKYVKRFFVVSLIGFVALSFTVPAAWGKDKVYNDDKKISIKKPKTNNKSIQNVIVMIPDGCDETVQTVARWYKGEDLQLDKMSNGVQKTHMANSIITGSAAASTAFATGHKTTVRFLGVGPRTEDLLTGFEPTADPYAPVASVLEAAKLKGMATGIVVTCRVTHATPAGFGVHIEDRGWDNDIIEHLVYNNIDVVFGGGFRHLIPEGTSYSTTFGDTWNGRRTDGDNLYQELLDRGYQFVDNKDDMNALSSGRVWGMFDDSHMQPDIDRKYFAEHEPSLAEMVAKAIELLSQDKDGFFLMVEGPQVDWAGHANDPIYMTTDFIAFDDAVKVACDFADKDGKTLVMAYPDHNTGGMKIGHNFTAMAYTETKIEDLVEPLKGMKITSIGLAAMMEGDYSIANIQDKVKEYWSLDITEEEAQYILDYQDAAGVSFDYALSNVLSMFYTAIGWTTHGHNGETVPVWVHPKSAPKGVIENTELAHYAAKGAGVNLANTTKTLYVDLDEVTMDYEIVGDPGIGSLGLLNNLVLKVSGAELPISKDYMVYEGEIIQLPGLTVYAPATEKVYVSKEALKIIGLL
jgi:alkaline phosphatase